MNDAKFVLHYKSVVPQPYSEPKLMSAQHTFRAESLHQAWQEAMDWMDCERKFTPVLFVSLDCDSTSHSQTLDVVKEYILPMTV